jgi:hypothetical protein
MELPNMTTATLTEGEPWQDTDPEAPAEQGWLGQSPVGGVSELWPHAVNDVIGEIIRGALVGGVYERARDSLRRTLYEDDVPPKDVLPLVVGVSAADIASQSGRYKRVGHEVLYQFFVEWSNTNAALDAEPLTFHLPYEASQSAIGRLAITQSNFRLDNPDGANQAYEPLIVSPPKVIAEMWRGNELGAASMPVPIGDSAADGGSRKALVTIWYKSTTIRNTLWPLIEWYSITHTPIAPGPTVVEYRYDGALNGDLVELLTYPGEVVADSHNITAPLPSGRGSFTIASAGQYTLRLRSAFSTTNIFTVSAS